jgi:hypothetical protein
MCGPFYVSSLDPLEKTRVFGMTPTDESRKE